MPNDKLVRLGGMIQVGVPVTADRETPADNELERAEYLLNCLHKECDFAGTQKRSRISIKLEEAKELVQLLADSIKTAKRLQQTNGRVRS